MTVREWLGEDNKLGIKIWEEKYRFNGETFDEWLDRLSDGDENLRKLILDKKFLYGGRILANLNTGTSQGVSNCITRGYVEDNMEDIMQTATDLAFSFKKEAGVGLALSKIRPKGARIGKIGKGTSDGVIGFLKIYNEITANISRGNARRGASFVGLSCEHPDVMDFIKIKKNNKGASGEITSANLSVLVTDEFMRNYKNGTKYRKDFHVESTGEIVKHIVDPASIMDAIVDEPKKAFEPGIIFIDRFQENHLFGNAEGAEWMMVNACTEFVGQNGTVCLLGSMNLSEYVHDGEFDIEDFRIGVRTAIRALDKAHEYGIGRNALQLQNERARDYRGLGLGVMGVADMFIKLGMKYGSKESLEISELIAKEMKYTAIEASRELALELGQPNGIKLDEEYLEKNGFDYIKGLRNNSLLSIAPAGTLSTMLGISTGIEPVFRSSYVRKTESLGNNGDQYHDVFHKAIQDVKDKLGYVPEYCIDTRDVTVEQKVDLISTWQKYVDLSISNTTNFDSNATVDDIKKLYVYGWENKVTGLTVYVDGSIEGVLNDKKSEDVKVATELKRGVMDSIPDDTIYIPKKLVHGCGELKVMIGYSKDKNKVTDVYIVPKMGQGCSKNIIGQAVLISQVLRLGGDLKDIQKSVSGIDACTSYYGAKLRGKEVSKGTNCPSGLLNLVIETQESLTKVDDKINNDGFAKCPECGEMTLKNEASCVSCTSCGYSKCS